MSHHEIKIANVDSPEVIDCIKVFDAELKRALNKSPEFDSVFIEQYEKKMADDAEKIHMQITANDKNVCLAFVEDFFDDYCYSTRKERDLILKATAEEIKKRLNN